PGAAGPRPAGATPADTLARPLGAASRPSQPFHSDSVPGRPSSSRYSERMYLRFWSRALGSITTVSTADVLELPATSVDRTVSGWLPLARLSVRVNAVVFVAWVNESMTVPLSRISPRLPAWAEPLNRCGIDAVMLSPRTPVSKSGSRARVGVAGRV